MPGSSLDPIVAASAATRSYVDNNVVIIRSIAEDRVRKAGDTMTGDLVLSDGKIVGLTQTYPPTNWTQAVCWRQATQLVTESTVSKTGDTITGNLDMGGNKITKLIHNR